MEKHNLAIVIPVYKATFLAQTLHSIANQTCKDFTLYIGDDASPYDIRSIVEQYVNKIDIVYKRFDENLGGKDLVAQWERCIALSCDEPWIWLFSDDDMMAPNCVEYFYNELRNAPHFDIYRFNVNIINRDDVIVSKCKAIKNVMSSEDIYYAKQKGKMNSFVVEYVFSREVYKKNNGFQNFDLAWGSDIATWMKFGREKGIKTIEHADISWRCSGENITTTEDLNLALRKLNADMKYLKWTNHFYGKSTIKIYNHNLCAKIIANAKISINFRLMYMVVDLYSSNTFIKFFIFIMVGIYKIYFAIIVKSKSLN